jgi:hypothetical protein
MGSLNSLGNTIIPAVSSMIPNPLAATLATAASNWAFGEYNEAQRYKDAEKSKSLQMQQARANANSDLKMLAENTRNAEEERLRNLKSAIAKQRAEFGASGVSSSGGSSSAVLEGFLNESTADKAARDRVDSLKTQAINDKVYQKNQTNLLELSKMEEENSFFKLFG